MAKGQLRPANEYFTLEHNARKSFTQNEVFADEKNEHLHTYWDAILKRQDWTENALKNYTQRTKQKSQIKHKHYSYVLKCTAETTPQEIYDSVGRWIEDKLGSCVYNISVHKDEGYIIDRKNPDNKLQSGKSFFYDRETGAYYKDKDHKTLLARDFNELKSKYEIVKNYHAHIELSGMRRDGSSIKAPSPKDRKQGILNRDQQEFFRLDKFTMTNINQRFLNMLNAELAKNGKAPAVQEISKDTERPKVKRHDVKLLAELERKIKLRQASQSEIKAHSTILEKSGLAAQRKYDEMKAQNTDLKSKIEALNIGLKDIENKKFNKSRAKEIFKKFTEIWNTKFDLLEISKDDEFRKSYFKDDADFLNKLDTDKIGLETYLERLVAKTELLDEKEIDIISTQKKKIKELLNEIDKINAKEQAKNENNQISIEINENGTKIDLTPLEIKNFTMRAVNNETNEAQRLFERLQAPNIQKDTRENLLNKLKNIFQRVEKWKQPELLKIFIEKNSNIDFTKFTNLQKTQGRSL